MERLLEGKTAIITGAGRGIGRAAAELFARYGARVVLSDIDAGPAEEAVGAILEANGEAVSVVGDVTDRDFAGLIVNAAIENFGGIDIIVNNAGYTWDAVIHKMTDEQWEVILAVHLTAPFRIIRAASEYLRETAKRERAADGRARARKIVNISSTSGTRGNAGQSNYSSGKAGVIGLTKTLAKEWGQFNIQVNAVAFGRIETRLTQAKERGETITREGVDIAIGIPGERLERTTPLIPMGRAGTALEAAGAIFFFASPFSDYVSGQVLEVAGGL
ncbi:MAG TPA: SDR family NAD(P)-dependent oxidoreductase [Blastocatellia bacterium]|nr:SDR family NAD(P)-dependent oxidoreductase [Blastocatellia bacterium]